MENQYLKEGFCSAKQSSFPISISRRNVDIPRPPPLPCKRVLLRRNPNRCSVPKETRSIWDRLFVEGFNADVRVLTNHNEVILAHSSILTVASTVLGTFLKKPKAKDGFRYIRIPGVPHGAVRAFLRFLYSSWYEEEDMNKFVLHLLVLSHSYSVPFLKNACVNFLMERKWLDTDNVIDVFVLARKCDSPKLSLFCVRWIVNDFETVVATDWWKVMKFVDPTLEQEVLEYVVEVDTRKEERAKKMEERKVYLQFTEVMEALIHICRDGCRTIGPRDKLPKVKVGSCNYPACKGLESLIRHFSNCNTRVRGGCMHCKRMSQIFELHSHMCNESNSCKIPLCSYFNQKTRQPSIKEEKKWKILVNKVVEVKNGLRFGLRR